MEPKKNIDVICEKFILFGLRNTLYSIHVVKKSMEYITSFLKIDFPILECIRNLRFIYL